MGGSGNNVSCVVGSGGEDVGDAVAGWWVVVGRMRWQ